MTQYTPKDIFFNQGYYVSADILVHYLNGFMPHEDPHEELRDGHLKLMHSGEDLMDIQFED